MRSNLCIHGGCCVPLSFILGANVFQASGRSRGARRVVPCLQSCCYRLSTLALHVIGFQLRFLRRFSGVLQLVSMFRGLRAGPLL